MARLYVVICTLTTAILFLTMLLLENTNLGQIRLKSSCVLSPLNSIHGYQDFTVRNNTDRRSIVTVDTAVFDSHLEIITSGVDSRQAFCSYKTEWRAGLQVTGSHSNLSDWSYKHQVQCPKFNVTDSKRSLTREKVTLECSAGNVRLLRTLAKSATDFDTVPANSSCLAEYIRNCCYDDHGVPRLVHYVWHFNNKMKFPTFVSLLSVIKFVKPCLILFHGEFVPHGKYWDFITEMFSNIVHVKRLRYETLFGKKLKFHEHSSDIVRIEALQQFGGMYLDTDFIILKNLDPFRNYEVTLCKQSSGFLLNSFIMSKRNATFLSLWLDGYKKDYRNSSYVYNSMRYNGIVAKEHPDLVHIEHGTLCRPKEMVAKPLDSKKMHDWSQLYGFHMYSRTVKFPLDELSIRKMNTTFGSMLRHIVFGNKDLCED